MQQRLLCWKYPSQRQHSGVEWKTSVCCRWKGPFQIRNKFINKQLWLRHLWRTLHPWNLQYRIQKTISKEFENAGTCCRKKQHSHRFEMWNFPQHSEFLTIAKTMSNTSRSPKWILAAARYSYIRLSAKLFFHVGRIYKRFIRKNCKFLGSTKNASWLSTSHAVSSSGQLIPLSVEMNNQYNE